MVDKIGQGGALAREAIRAALDAQASAAERVRPGGADALGADAAAPSGADFASELKDGLEAVQAEVAKAEQLPADFVAGEIQDFHEIAVQLKQADVSFRFALEVRNKLIDAYREVMRMQV